MTNLPKSGKVLYVKEEMNMLSPFGKFCRKLRIEKGELLLDMANKLNVKSSYLSSVEVGRKSIPESWKKEIAKIYELNEEETKELEKSIEESVRQIKINMQDRSENDRQFLLAFARKLDDLELFEKESILKILQNNKKNGGE